MTWRGQPVFRWMVTRPGPHGTTRLSGQEAVTQRASTSSGNTVGKKARLRLQGARGSSRSRWTYRLMERLTTWWSKFDQWRDRPHRTGWKELSRSQAMHPPRLHQMQGAKMIDHGRAKNDHGFIVLAMTGLDRKSGV